MTMFPDPKTPITFPSTPSVAIADIIFSILRHFLSAGGAVGMVAGLSITDSNLTTLSGAIAWLISVGWSLIQKKQAAQKDHMGSVLSADLKQAVRVE